MAQVKPATPMSAFAVREAKKTPGSAKQREEQQQRSALLPNSQLPKTPKQQPSQAATKKSQKRNRDATPAAFDDLGSSLCTDEKPMSCIKKSKQKSVAVAVQSQAEVGAMGFSAPGSSHHVAVSSASPQLPSRRQSAGSKCAQPGTTSAAVIPTPGGKSISGKTKGSPAASGKTKQTAVTAASEQSQHTAAATKKREAQPEVVPVLLETAERSDGDSCSSWSGVEFTDSEADAKSLFAKLIHPVSIETFFDSYWGKKPLLVQRQNSHYYQEDNWFSTAELDRILRTEDLQFGVNIDITSYEGGRRETHNPSGRAHAAVVWDMYQTGCSVRLLNPQTYCNQTWQLLATLQELFGSAMGANTYLTPPDSQGFAPHYDDIDAFVLQLEGRKRWRIYDSRNPSEKLPRFSSGNFKQEEIGVPILECTLKPGDLLYFPRGAIHQAHTVEGYHSLHMTVSTHQKNTYADLLEKLLPAALERAVRSKSKFRESLPTNYLSYTGAAYGDEDSLGWKRFTTKLRLLFKDLWNHLPVDDVCDQMGKRFVHDCLPPYLTESETMCSVHGSGERWSSSEHCVRGSIELEPDTRVRLLRKHILRMVLEPVPGEGRGDEEAGVLRLYHSSNNARVFQGREPQFIDASPKVAPAIKHLLESYPAFVAVDSLPLGNLEDKMALAFALYDAGVLVTETCLAGDSEEGSSSDDDDDYEEEHDDGDDNADVTLGTDDSTSESGSESSDSSYDHPTGHSR